MSDLDEIKRQHPLATEDGLRVFTGLLMYMGAMCPKCGHGTRVTSKRWARCKKCETRVLRQSLDNIPLQPAVDQPHTSKGLP